MRKEIKEHLQKDKKLASILDKHELYTADKPESLFVALIETIIAQQLSLKAAATILERFYLLFPGEQLSPRAILDKEHEELRGAGLSNQKAKYVKNVSDFFDDDNNKNMDWDVLSDEDITAKLVSIKGVGEWTAHMILMFTLQREDVLPLGDLIVRKKMMELYELEDTGKDLYQKLEQIAEAWRPYRSYASRCLWATHNA